jgi:hypothetical protein
MIGRLHEVHRERRRAILQHERRRHMSGDRLVALCGNVKNELVLERRDARRAIFGESKRHARRRRRRFAAERHVHDGGNQDGHRQQGSDDAASHGGILPDAFAARLAVERQAAPGSILPQGDERIDSGRAPRWRG